MSTDGVQDFNLDVRKICVIGAGYVGGPTGAVFALKCPHITVTVVDLSEERISQWNSEKLPIYEPGPKEVIKKTHGVNLHFTTNIAEAIHEADMIFICVNTPSKSYGIGENFATDLTYVDSAVRMIAEYSTSPKIIVEKSTVPVKTVDSVKVILNAKRQSGFQFQVLSNPELLSESTAIHDLLHPQYVMIGSDRSDHGRQAMTSLSNIYLNWVPKERIVVMNTKSSELAKVVQNAMRAQQVASINSMSVICESTGADMLEISKFLHPFIGPKYYLPNLGFGGSCFRKDVSSLIYLSETLDLPVVANYWRQVLVMNDYQRRRFTLNIIKCLHNTLRNKSIAILGFAFKKNTGDIRLLGQWGRQQLLSLQMTGFCGSWLKLRKYYDVYLVEMIQPKERTHLPITSLLTPGIATKQESSAIIVARDLLAEGALLRVYDPKAQQCDIIRDLKYASKPENLEKVESNMVICRNAYDATKGCHAVVICTEWDEFKALDYARIYEGMDRPAWIFDGWTMLDHCRLMDIGYSVRAIGKQFNSSIDQN